jgi:Na+/phosphate symporter
MVISWLVILIAVAGLVIFLAASTDRPQRVGLVMFGCGLLAACLLLGGRSVHLP